MSRADRGDKKPTTAAERNRKKLLAYLIDFDNDLLKRQEYSEVILGYKNPNQIYRTLSPSDLSAIEAEALQTIKDHSAPQRSELYKSLYLEGKSGNVKAIKEFLDRTEGKVPDKQDVTLTPGEGVSFNVKVGK